MLMWNFLASTLLFFALLPDSFCKFLGHRMSLGKIVLDKESISFTNSPNFTCWEQTVNLQQHTGEHLAEPGDRAPGYSGGSLWAHKFQLWPKEIRIQSTDDDHCLSSRTLWGWHSWLPDHLKRRTLLNVSFLKEAPPERENTRYSQSSDRKNEILANLLFARRAKALKAEGFHQLTGVLGWSLQLRVISSWFRFFIFCCVLFKRQPMRI